MPSPTSRRILRAVSLTGLLAIASLGQAEAPNPVLPKGSHHPEPPPTATPTVTPSSTPLLGQIQVQVPKDPIRVETAIKPVETKPLEIKPLQIQLPNQDLHVTAAGIPEKITLQSDIKWPPLDLRWPRDPLNISIDLKNAGAGSNGSDLQKLIDTFSGLNRQCAEQLKDLNKQLADAKRQAKQLQETIDSSKEQQDKCNEQVTDLNNKLRNVRNQLAEERERYRQELDRLLQTGALTKEDFEKFAKELEGRPSDNRTSTAIIVLWIVAVGAIGGLAGDRIAIAGRKRLGQRRQGETSVRDADVKSTDAPRDIKTPKKTFDDLLAAMALGIVAAFMIPAFLRIVSVVRLQAISENQSTLVYLYSLCFVAATLGEPFIESVSIGFLRLVNAFFEWAVLRANAWIARTATKVGGRHDD